MNRIIAIEQAQPGMMIVRVTAQNGPVKINKSGLITSPAMIQGLIEMGVQEIEYDPDQTVEICPETPPSATEQTPTQALLRGQFDTRAQKTDSAISDQFNRSLFLPSVNGLPGWWQRSVKPAVMAITLALGGAATGYALAVLPNMLTQATNPPVAVPTTTAIAEPTTAPTSELTKAPSPGSDASPASAEVNTASQQSTVETPVAAMSDSQNSANRDTQLKTEVLQPETVNTANNFATDTQEPQREEPATGTITTNKTVSGSDDRQNEAAVSPELMARFNKVLSDLEQEEERGEPLSNNTTVNIHDDIQRVDQLPARLLTRLPTMDFSAHMYASRPADRWVRVNGQDKSEGEWISDSVQIVNIEAQRVILRFEGEVFAMSALTDW